MYFDVVTKLIPEIFGQTLIASDSTRLSEARKTQGGFKIFFCLYLLIMRLLTIDKSKRLITIRFEIPYAFDITKFPKNNTRNSLKPFLPKNFILNTSYLFLVSVLMY